MSKQVLKPCDCEAGFCNRLPNPFYGHYCRHAAEVDLEDEPLPIYTIDSAEGYDSNVRYYVEREHYKERAFKSEKYNIELSKEIMKLKRQIREMQDWFENNAAMLAVHNIGGYKMECEHEWTLEKGARNFRCVICGETSNG